MTYHVTVSSKRQFTIPKAIREQLGVKPGDRVAVTVEDGMMVLAPIGDIVAETAGSLARYVRRRE
jgi:AbrB family looped-hinge helix DNA binding protein